MSTVNRPLKTVKPKCEEESSDQSKANQLAPGQAVEKKQIAQDLQQSLAQLFKSSTFNPF